MAGTFVLDICLIYIKSVKVMFRFIVHLKVFGIVLYLSDIAWGMFVCLLLCLHLRWRPATSIDDR